MATLRALADPAISEAHIAEGIKSAAWPARMQRLGPGALWSHLPADAELWLDGGHNHSAGRALAQALPAVSGKWSLKRVWHM